MRIPLFRLSCVVLLGAVVKAPLVLAQSDEAAADTAAQASEAAEQIAETAEEGGKSFEDALDEVEKNRSSLLSDGEDAPYLFEYEYEYEYDSDYNSGFKPRAPGGAVAGAESGPSGDRIEEAGKELVDASLLAPKSRVREQFVKLGGESLSTIGLHSLNDLVGTGVRGMLIQPNEFSSSTLDLTLRGISGTAVDQVTGESGVGVFIDGVPVLRGQAYGLGLLDLENIDLLRGSRGVVAGRNASGGAVYMNSRKPSGEFGFRQRVRLGFAHDDVQSITNIDLPAVTGLPMARLSYLTSDHPGWIENESGVDANDFPQRENEAFRIALTTVPSDRLSIDFALERSDLESTHHYFQVLDIPGNVPASQIPDISIEDADVEDTRGSLAIPVSRTDQTAVTLNSSYVINENLELKMIFGWSELEDENFVNFDRLFDNGELPLDVGGTDRERPGVIEGRASRTPFENRIGYGELQLNGKAYGDLLNFSVGISRLDDSSDVDDFAEADLVSTSIYATTVWSLSDELSLTAGVRSTEDEKDFERSALALDTGTTLITLLDEGEAFLDDSETDFVLAADYDINKQLSAYASWSTGYKAGGASLFAEWEGNDSDDDIYDPETTETIQVGLKGKLLDSKLYFDAALFSTDIDDRQLVFANPSNRRSTNIINASETVTISGFELDLRYNPIESLRLGAFVTLLDADEITVDGVYRRNNSNLSSTPARLQYEFDVDNPSTASRTAYVERAPDTSIALTADYKFGVGQSRDSVFRLEYINTSGYHYDSFTKYDESRSLVNARVLFSGFELEGSDDGKIQISLWVENLLDEEYVVNALEVDNDPSSGTPSNYTVGAYGEPLTYGIDIDFLL